MEIKLKRDWRGNYKGMEITGQEHEVEDVGMYKNIIEMYMKENDIEKIEGNSGFDLANRLRRGDY
ncbi:MAG: hypothetical protein JW789_04565 [Candidatus Aenigmarchaeota archaeon]|nr:hypothetical protein [Candidatus Aenigmarchaeota archaeon]